MKTRLGLLVPLAAIVLLGVVPACASVNASELDGTSWILESYGLPSDLIPIVEGTSISVDFESNGVVSGSTGCNAFVGTYEVTGNALTIQYEIGSGPRCDLSRIVEQEQMFLATIVHAESYAIDADTLTIDCGERILVLQRRQDA
jgi:heat shock protein HslJ